MELIALYKRVVGLDVHQAQITACALIEEADGSTRIEQRQFGTFKRDRRELAHWVAELHPDEVVMESPDIYWKSPFSALEAVGIRAKVVNARHVKNVPGRKTDVGDARWLATLARAGLARRIVYTAGETTRIASDCPSATETGQSVGSRKESAAQSTD
jgi:transposase